MLYVHGQVGQQRAAGVQLIVQEPAEAARRLSKHARRRRDQAYRWDLGPGDIYIDIYCIYIYTHTQVEEAAKKLNAQAAVMVSDLGTSRDKLDKALAALEKAWDEAAAAEAGGRGVRSADQDPIYIYIYI